MRITSYSGCDDGVLYVPNYNGNRDDEDADKMKVYILPLSNKDMMKWRSQILQDSEKRGNNKFKQVNLLEYQRKLFISNVVKIENFEIFVKKENRTISEPTSAEVYDYAPTELIEEILVAIQDSSMLDEEKKWTNRISLP